MRLIIKDITVEVFPERIVTLHIRWHGGATKDIKIAMPKKIHAAWKTSPEIIERVRSLAAEFSNQSIAEIFNKEGIKTNKGNAFTEGSIRAIRYQYGIPRQHNRQHGMLTVKEVMHEYGVSKYVVYYWIARNVINACRVGSSSYEISIDEQKKAELRELVNKSYKIKKQTSLTITEGGAL